MSSEANTSDAQLREEVRAWLSENWTADKAEAIKQNQSVWGASDALKGWLGEVVEARWAAPRWPEEWFGRGLSNDQGKVIEREFAAVGAPGSGQCRTNMWANTLLARGQQGLKEKLIGPLLRNEVNMCLLYSEPGAGSDLAGIRTRLAV